MKNKYLIADDHVVIFLKRRNGEILESIIDIEDLDIAVDYPLTFYAWYSPHTKSYYCVGNHVDENGKRGMVLLHRMVMKSPIGYFVDHIDHDTLNNRKSNLRVVTPSDNSKNRKRANSSNKTGVRGVTWNSQRKKYQVHVTKDKKSFCLGLFEELEDAKRAADEFRAKNYNMP